MTRRFLLSKLKPKCRVSS